MAEASALANCFRFQANEVSLDVSMSRVRIHRLVITDFRALSKHLECLGYDVAVEAHKPRCRTYRQHIAFHKKRYGHIHNVFEKNCSGRPFNGCYFNFSKGADRLQCKTFIWDILTTAFFHCHEPWVERAGYPEKLRAELFGMDL